MHKTCGIYKITSPTNRIYIGQSKDCETRRMYYIKLKCVGQVKLYHSIKKYGWEKHKFEVIHTCEPNQLDNLEIYYIEKFKTFNSKYGLNLRKGGTNGKHSKESLIKMSNAKRVENLSDETRRRLSESKKGSKNPFYKKEFSKEHRENLSKAGKGRKMSEESKKKLSESRKGIVFSEEHKNNLRLSHLGYKPTDSHRRNLSLAQKKRHSNLKKNKK